MFTIGCDPEFFIKKNHKHMSAIGLIGGTKQQPKDILPKNRGFGILEDNVAVEFNVPICYSAEDLKSNIKHVITSLKKKQIKGYDISTESAVIFDKDQLMHPQAQEFGCEPDFNAWTKGINPRPKADEQNLRSDGGHIHVGTKEDPIEVIRAMDLFLGVPSIVMDKGKLRRQLYGKAGCFRPKPYGCEYRTLSNFWIFSDELIQWAYDQTAKALQFIEDGNTIDVEHGKMIQSAINNEDMGSYEALREPYRFA